MITARKMGRNFKVTINGVEFIVMASLNSAIQASNGRQKVVTQEMRDAIEALKNAE